ncbi:uncharacterized protein LOC115879560 [Sitophilus oryzae]|uniref:Uncharacterized protein LOC115879560 n=1 Tax=Sitophilus oryzae TaxID=7048 RepID=A0A6J2XNU0_SITOR|nr:uncharacterized protein LOC115879560 [Sitophilus oryzae]
MSTRTKKILALAVQNQRENQENIPAIANSSHRNEDCNKVLSSEDVAEMIQEAVVVFEDGFCSELTPDIFKTGDSASKDEQENPLSCGNNLVKKQIRILSDINLQKYSDPVISAKEDIMQIVVDCQEQIVVKSPDQTSPTESQQQTELPPNIFQMETSVRKEKQEELQSHEVNLTEEETVMETDISSSDDETPLIKRKKGQKKRDLNKKLRMSGGKYIEFRKPKGQKNTFHDTPRNERRLKDRCNCKDPSKQCLKFTDDDRNRIFPKFWSDMSWEQRKVFVATTVQVCPRKRPEADNSRRSVTLKYHLILNDAHIPVCKLMYLNTLNLGEWSARSWALSANNGMIKSNEVDVSLRSKRKDIFKEDREFLEAFLGKLNKLPSHYCRKDTQQLYLEQTFQSWNDLFKVYQKQCADNNRNVLSSKLLRQMAKKMKIAIFSPRKDQCDVCFMFKNGNVPEEDYQKHIEAKNTARAEKERDKADALEKRCHVITMMSRLLNCHRRFRQILLIKRKMEENEAPHSSQPQKKKIKRYCTFIPEWEDMFEHIKKVDAEHGMCKLCSAHFTVKFEGKRAVENHCNSQKHKNNIRDLKSRKNAAKLAIRQKALELESNRQKLESKKLAFQKEKFLQEKEERKALMQFFYVFEMSLHLHSPFPDHVLSRA